MSQNHCVLCFVTFVVSLRLNSAFNSIRGMPSSLHCSSESRNHSLLTIFVFISALQQNLFEILFRNTFSQKSFPSDLICFSINIFYITSHRLFHYDIHLNLFRTFQTNSVNMFVINASNTGSSITQSGLDCVGFNWIVLNCVVPALDPYH